MADAQSTTTVVEYRELPYLPGYRIGDDGSVLSQWPIGRTRAFEGKWRPIKLRRDRDGYDRAWLMESGKQKSFPVHRLVLEAFVGPCPDGMEACHNDGSPNNNLSSNLRWATHTSNMRDRSLHGRNPEGERSPLAKLTDAQVAEIRAAYYPGCNKARMARQYGVTDGTIYCIVLGKTWKHLLPVQAKGGQ